MSLRSDRPIRKTAPERRRIEPSVDIEGDVITRPNSFAPANTVESFRIPRRRLTVRLGKSTGARSGIVVDVTPFEPEWDGDVTIEVSNTASLPAKIGVNRGTARAFFFEAEEVCEVSHTDRRGKYGKQTGTALSIL
ncbi:MAG: hypothetical protein AAGE99_02305 [Chlamydiota bacterium]